MYYTIKFLRQVSLRFGETAIVPACQIEHQPGSFRDSLLFRWQLSGVARWGTKVLYEEAVGFSEKGESS